MTTWNDIISLVFRDSGVLGVGQTLQAQDTTDAIRRFNMMLDQWKRRRWLVYHLVDLTIPLDGSLFYEIGVGATVNYPRPDKIESAFVRQITPSAQPNQPDFPLRIISSWEEYSRITLKQLRAGPAWLLFYDSGYPEGKIYPWPLMSSQYELHVQVKDQLVSIDRASDTVVLPPEYEQAIYATQVNATRRAYRLPPDPEFKRLEAASMETLRSSNFQVPTLNLPSTVQGGGAYSIWSDTFGPGGR